MIHRLTANFPSFKPVTFTNGLNLILADRTLASTNRDTRNGLGKTTLVDIVDFCLGSSSRRTQGLFLEPLNGWEFTLDITIAGDRVRVTRAIDSPNTIAVEGDTSPWLQPNGDSLFSQSFVKTKQWNASLGHALFGLTERHDAAKYGPTYRSLMAYFIRRGNDAYVDTFQNYRQQPPWNIQVNIAFLLGLNWEHASRWQQIKDRERALSALQKAIETGGTEYAFGSIGGLRGPAYTNREPDGKGICRASKLQGSPPICRYRAKRESDY